MGDVLLPSLHFVVVWEGTGTERTRVCVCNWLERSNYHNIKLHYDHLWSLSCRDALRLKVSAQQYVSAIVSETTVSAVWRIY